MSYFSPSKLNRVDFTRREFLWAGSLFTLGFFTGCAPNPVTGRVQLMLISEEDEIKLDRQFSPQQFSTDYGISLDAPLNQYIARVGQGLVPGTHRPKMPYSFQCVNATYINAYAFPGGTIGVTRGILLELESEAELASLLGHELGHVNARHTAERLSRGQITQMLVTGLSILAAARSPALGDVASSLGMLGAGVLLAAYSRDDEREADALGMDYAVNTGYNPDGFVRLMAMLQGLSQKKPAATEILFSTHPWSAERYQTALSTASGKYTGARKNPLHRERYLDNTARLRRLRGAISEMQLGERDMAARRLTEAESRFRKALQQAPEDYAGLLLLAKSLILQERHATARPYIEEARRVYPQEPQSQFLSGLIRLEAKEFESALRDFTSYDKALPGNPQLLFLRGYAQEGMGRIKPAAELYHRYLQVITKGEDARHARRRLVEWGFIKG